MNINFIIRHGSCSGHDSLVNTSNRQCITSAHVKVSVTPVNYTPVYDSQTILMAMNIHEAELNTTDVHA